MPSLLIGPKYVAGVVPLIADAKRTIDIIIFDWRLYSTQLNHPVTKLTSALTKAVARGVRVRMLGANALTRAQLQGMGIKTKALYATKLVHAKVMCIDGNLAILGSHNFTQSAFSRNLEVSLVADLGAAAAQFQQYFDNLWGV